MYMTTPIQISADVYNGFTIYIDNKRLCKMSNKDIIKEIKNTMKIFFLSHNLKDLEDGVYKLNLHIHQKIIPSQKVYVCDCIK